MRLMQVIAGAAHGGAETFFTDMALALGRRGVVQKLAIRGFADRVAQLEASNCDVQTFRFGGPLDLITPIKLARMARDFQPDVLLGWMNRACNILPTGPFTRVGRLGGYYDLKYYNRCDYLICNTPDLVDHAIGDGWPAERLCYIPNFCPVTNQDAVDRSVLKTPHDARVLLILARLQPVKGIDIAIQSLAKTQNTYLWIAGDGPLDPHLRKQARECLVADRVKFLGWREDRTALLRAADVCLVPSRHEPFGNVILNAWAHGIPVISTRSQGPGFLIRDGKDGILVPVDDSGALAEAILRLIASPDLSTQLVTNGFSRVAAEFSEEAVTGSYMDLFEKLKTRRYNTM